MVNYNKKMLKSNLIAQLAYFLMIMMIMAVKVSFFLIIFFQKENNGLEQQLA